MSIGELAGLIGESMFANVLRQAIDEDGRAIDDIADSAGIPFAMLWNFKHLERRNLPFEMVDKLLQCLDLELELKPSFYGQSLREIANLVDVEPQMMRRARSVLEQGTEEQIKAVESGKATVDEVYEQIRGKV